jgi:hypothetical protein
LTKRRARTLAGVALSAALVLALVYVNVADLLWLQDHPLPTLIFWPVVWVLLTAAVVLLIPPDRRTRPVTALVFGAVGLLLLGVGGYRAVRSALPVDDSADRGELVDHASSADGRYEIRVFHWQAVLGEDGWDFVVQRRDRLRGVSAYAGCLFGEESGDYTGIQSVGAGSVRIATEDRLVDVAFEPDTMRVTQRIPEDLCRGYG